MDLLELNTWLCAALAASVAGNIFWFLKWAFLKDRYMELLERIGYDYFNP